MAFTRTATASWRGNGPSGTGALSTMSGAFADQPYSAKARFESADGRAGTNPEELIAAAHAGCYTMALSFGLTKAGHEPTELRTTATVTMDKLDAGWTITGIHLDTQGKVAGVDAAKFAELADAAKKGCPISRALASVLITLAAKLL